MLPALLPIALVAGAVNEVLLTVALFDSFEPTALVDFTISLQPPQPVILIVLKPPLIDRSHGVNLFAFAFSRATILHHLTLVSCIALVLFAGNLKVWFQISGHRPVIELAKDFQSLI